ncbi:MAG: sulfotransferase family protein, partial [Planctomycetota bacterium]
MTEATPPSEDQEQISSHQPFFLIGAERSGTTLLRLMLDHHPEIRCQFESSFYVDYLLDDGSEPPFEVLDKHIRMDRVARMSEFSLQPGLNFKETARAFLEEDAKRSGVRIYGATIHRRFRHILQVWPDARFVNLVRDPRDVAPSVIKMGWAGNTWHGSRLWAEAQQEAERLFDMVPKDRQLTLRFEDLVTTPVETFSRLCVFLGTSFQEAAMRY